MKSPNSIRESRLFLESHYVTKSLKGKSSADCPVGRSTAIQELFAKIEKVASCKVDVLILGESGTGKELVARTVHYLSPRAEKPFIPVNCGAIPESLFENELFGHVKGAFTDAGLQQIGLVREAEAGTLFLDEISVVTPYNQVKLLRLLQNKEYKPLGDSRPHRADIRIIAATNRYLQDLVEQGMFRKDLFYRLNVVSLHVPPLRQRMEDIPILVEHFINKYSREYGKAIKGLSKRAMSALMSYSWPGNVRELENKIQQMVVMSIHPIIDVETFKLPLNGTNSKESEPGYFNVAKKKAIASFERTYLMQLLAEYKGDMVAAARKAGKSRTGLWNLVSKYGLSPRQFRH